jgi:NAD(P)-dependent dehydrogenase (short-subunit alcohol dehydrogenase family)
MELKDLKIIVTGGAQGMGAHFVHRLAEAGIVRLGRCGIKSSNAIAAPFIPILFRGLICNSSFVQGPSTRSGEYDKCKLG